VAPGYARFDISDLIGLETEEAVAALEADGISYVVKETKPPFGRQITGRRHVVRARFDDALRCAELVVTYW
jgi:hypothetical protein